MSVSVIILAAGKSVRMNSEKNKEFLELNGKLVLDYSIDFFKNYDRVKEIILVCSDTDFNYCYSRYEKLVDHIVIGGNTRQKSVYNGLKKVSMEYVMIHDAARPFINEDVIEKLYHEVLDVGAATVAVFVKDTIVEISDNRIARHLNRKSLVALQTPQAFKKGLIMEAHIKAIEGDYFATDDTSLIRKFTNVMPAYVVGDYRSLKLTTQEDLTFLERVL